MSKLITAEQITTISGILAGLPDAPVVTPPVVTPPVVTPPVVVPPASGVPTLTVPTGYSVLKLEEFTRDAPLGQFLQVYTDWSSSYPDGTPDTNSKNNAGRGLKTGYYPSKTVSVSGGVLDIWCHTEGGVAMAAALIPNWGFGAVYDRIELGIRAVGVTGPGFKIASLEWPDSWQWTDGEIDWPEGSLGNGPGGFNHYPGNPQQQDVIHAPAGTAFAGWHLFGIDRFPTHVDFYLDGHIVGQSSHAPTKAMHLDVQVESEITGTQPAAGSAAHVQVAYAGLLTRNA